jgi:hypothetical protein
MPDTNIDDFPFCPKVGWGGYDAEPVVCGNERDPDKTFCDTHERQETQQAAWEAEVGLDVNPVEAR